MKSNKNVIIFVWLEALAVTFFIIAIILELFYIYVYKISLFVAIESLIPSIGFYALFLLMQRHTQVWNVFIPVTIQNQVYAQYLARGLKVLFCTMMLYTAICDFMKITGTSIVFWMFLILALFLISYCKYKMWKISNKQKK